MAETIAAKNAALDHKDHSVIPADMALKNQALRPGSAGDIAALLANAENAMSALRAEFGNWLDSEAARLAQLLDVYLAESSPAQKDILYRSLHDMRANAAAFGNPLAGQIADHLCKLFDAATHVPSAIVEAHIRSIQAVVREKATTVEHAVGGVIIRELVRASAALAPANPAAAKPAI
jgi:hypothetical protein